MEKRLPICLLILSFISCHTHPAVDKGILKDILGCWRGEIIVNNVPRPAEMRLFSTRSDGSLAISVVYELGTRSRIWASDTDVTISGNDIAWEGCRGTLDTSRDVMRMTKAAQGEKSEWLFVRDPGSDALMERIRADQGRPWTYTVPAERDDGWRVADLNDAGFEKAKIADFLERVARGKHNDIHSLVIVRDGKLVLEEYFAGRGKFRGPVIADIFRDRVHHLASTTKTVLSSLVGIAIDQGFIQGVEDPIYRYLPSYAPLLNEEKKKIRVKHMLTMTPGFEWDQFGSGPRPNDSQAMWNCGDVVQYVLNKRLEAEPGLKFKYSNGVPTVMGVILKNASGLEVGVFAESRLFQPLGISKYLWTSYPDGSVETDGGLALRPRDLAKIGQLYLNEGTWNEARIVSADWVRESTRERLRFGFGGFKEWGYGYYWMQTGYHARGREIRSYFHSGDGGQLLSVFPDLNMVIVFTAGNYGTIPNRTYDRIMEKYILPAVSSISPPEH